jgi:hypothetical protein
MHSCTDIFTARSRRVRRRAWCVAVVAWMIPVLVLGMIVGSLGGASLMAHEHHGHGTHWHAAGTSEAAVRLAAAHVSAHRTGASHSGIGHEHGEGEHSHDATHEHPADDGEDSEDRGVLITIPLHDQLGGRLGLTHAIFTAVEVFPLPAWALQTYERMVVDADQPFGRTVLEVSPHGALCLCARLVSTSHALLI